MYDWNGWHADDADALQSFHGFISSQLHDRQIHF